MKIPTQADFLKNFEEVGTVNNGTTLRRFVQNSVILKPKAEESHRRSGWDSSALSGPSE